MKTRREATASSDKFAKAEAKRRRKGILLNRAWGGGGWTSTHNWIAACGKVAR